MVDVLTALTKILRLLAEANVVAIKPKPTRTKQTWQIKLRESHFTWTTQWQQNLVKRLIVKQINKSPVNSFLNFRRSLFTGRARVVQISGVEAAARNFGSDPEREVDSNRFRASQQELRGVPTSLVDRKIPGAENITRGDGWQGSNWLLREPEGLAADQHCRQPRARGSQQKAHPGYLCNWSTRNFGSRSKHCLRKFHWNKTSQVRQTWGSLTVSITGIKSVKDLNQINFETSPPCWLSRSVKVHFCWSHWSSISRLLGNHNTLFRESWRLGPPTEARALR